MRTLAHRRSRRLSARGRSPIFGTSQLTSEPFTGLPEANGITRPGRAEAQFGFRSVLTRGGPQTASFEVNLVSVMVTVQFSHLSVLCQFQRFLKHSYSKSCHGHRSSPCMIWTSMLRKRIDTWDWGKRKGALASLLVLTTTAQPAFMVLLGALFLLRIPHLYWSMRGRYEQASIANSTNGSRSVLTYRGGSQMDRKARWLIPIAMAIVGAVLAGAGMVVS